MRKLHEVGFAWMLYQDERDGALYVDALCNHSAAYFTVAFRLLPDEEKVVLRPDGGGPTTAGVELIERLARKAQWSPQGFRAARTAAWRARGHDEEPPVPPLEA